jgi:Rrf2 family iron-sulfur cluster assembly transcriptional regulator
VALADIAARQEISLSYLEQLFARLRRKGLVVSARGPGGGYRLARTAETLIAEIVLAVDEPLRATRCGLSPRAGQGLHGRRRALPDPRPVGGDGPSDPGYLASVSVADVLGGRLVRSTGGGRVSIKHIGLSRLQRHRPGAAGGDRRCCAPWRARRQSLVGARRRPRRARVVEQARAEVADLVGVPAGSR